MNKKILVFGKIIRFFSSFFFSKVIHPNIGIHVTYTHEVRKDDLENFESIIKFINKSHTFISPEKFFEYLDNDNIPSGKFVLMTFDDGFLSSFRAAKKILNKYGIKAIFFVPTAILNLNSEEEMLHFATENIYYNKIKSKSLVPDDYLFMTAEHILDLANDGHMICPHTHNHVWIKNITNELMVKKELIEPKKTIEKLIQTSVRAFAFPVGTEKQVGQYAYKHIYQQYDYCFTALNGINMVETDKYKLHRINLPADAPKSYIDMALHGIYDPYYKLKMNILSRKVE